MKIDAKFSSMDSQETEVSFDAVLILVMLVADD